MDILSHALWGGVLFGRKSRLYFWLSFVIGGLPDFLSFGIFLITTLFGITEQPVVSYERNLDVFTVPDFVNTLYNITHSFIIFAAVFGLVWLILRRPFLPLLAWAFHILLDIFTHSIDVFPTPFLWPISDFKIGGHSWGSFWIFIPNIILIIAVYSFWFWKKKKKGKINSWKK